ncbi:MAG TPA: hypothetical protein VHQ91_03335 [Geminicoccaceae bacterium]|nr:hypothetical protein [Geminicoccaceae bacterium]
MPEAPRAPRPPRRPEPGTGPADRFRAPAAPTIQKDTADHLRLAIRLTAARPELGPLCAGVRFASDPALDLPFRVTAGDRILLHPGSLAHPVAATITLRHTLERALWRRLGGPDPAPAGHARALLAARVAARYGALLPAGARAEGLAALPDWLGQAYRLLAGEAPDWQRLPAELLRLDGAAAGAAPGAGERELREQLLPLAAPSEDLLVSGGGSRLRLDPCSGRSSYGCSARPEPEQIEFASSTAATISVPAYRAVEAVRQQLIEAGLAGRLPAALGQTIADVRRAILAAGGVEDLPGIEVVLTPSGTDGEYAALHLARRRAAERLVNIVMAPEETGRGLRDAARGLHFTPETPAGATVAQGASLAGLEPAAITLETIEIRTPDGTPRRPSAVDAEVKARALRAVARGARCLVHLLEVSKSGLGAPSLPALRELCRRHPERIEVLVDACQLRGGPASLRNHLEAGWMVLITGSKFAMGPPFAGALLVPARLAEQVPGLDPLPAGYGQYFARPEWPDRWPALTAALPAAPNLGLLLRWRAALFELESLRAIPEAVRQKIVGQLGDAIRQAIEGSPRLVPVPAPVTGAGEPLPTIFSFTVLRANAGGRERPMELDATRQLWRWLQEDVSDRLPAWTPEAERRLAARVCRVGQPIRLGSLDGVAIGALRICIGARQIIEAALDPSLGKSVEQRLQRQIGRATMVLEKLDLIARHFDRLQASIGTGDPVAAVGDTDSTTA